MNRSDPPKLSLSIDKFCELYNDVPKVFEAYATLVNLNAETYRGNTAQIMFEEEINSNYWIISSNIANDAWLVPNPSRKVNYASLRSLPFAFDSNNQDHLKQLSPFVLSEPAQVISMPTEPTTWKLTKRGVIVFGDGQQNRELRDIISSVEIEEMVEIIASKKIMKVEKSLSSLYDGIKNQYNGIVAFLDLQNNKNHQLDDQNNLTEKSLKDYEKQVQNLIREQQKQAEEIKALKFALIHISVNQSDPSATVVSKDTTGVTTNAIKLSYTKREMELIREYNSNLQEVPQSLRDDSEIVSITDDAIGRIRLDGDESNITLKPDRKGNYYIISQGGYCYLVPSKRRRIIAQLSTADQAIYKYDGYNENYQSFRLIKPALVTEESNDCWKLSQKGILEFSSVKVAADVAPSYPCLETYVQSVKTFQNQYNPKTVAEDIDSFQKRSAGEHEDIILREYNHGLYWLFNDDSLIYLIPAPMWKVNQTNVQAAKNLFNCENYTRECQHITIRGCLKTPDIA